MARWSIPLDEYFEGVERNLADDFRALGFQLLANVLKTTPVDTGRLRSAWLITLDVRDTETENTPDQGAGALSKLKLTSTIYLQNNVEYGPYVNDGTTRMEGQHFVEAAIQGLTG